MLTKPLLPKATGSITLHRAPILALIFGLSVIGSAWALIYESFSAGFTGLQADQVRQVTLSAASIEHRLSDFIARAESDANYFRKTGLSPAAAGTQSEDALAGLNAGDSELTSALYTSSGRGIADADAGSHATQYLSSDDLNQLAYTTPVQGTFLKSEKGPTGLSYLRFGSVIRSEGTSSYLVARVDAKSFLDVAWLKTVVNDYSLEIVASNHQVVGQFRDTVSDSGETTQSSLTRWIHVLHPTVSAEAKGRPGSPLGAARLTFYGSTALTNIEQRGRNTVIFGIAVTGIILAGLFLSIQALNRVKANEKKLITLVTIDALTELPNRRSLNEQLDALFQGPQPENREAGLLFVDLDNFKPVNDTHGHKMGDLLLRAVAHRLRAAVGETEVICRLGGDEFAIITLTEDGRRKMQQIAQAVVDCFAEPFVLEGIQINTAASVGLAYFTDCRTSSEFLKNADMAMYDAKNAGKGNYREFSAEMALKSLEAEQLALALKPALQAKQFKLVYQPKVSTFTGNVVGFEALLRWNHPERGAVSPSVFIPLAEANGLIHEIGGWVLARAVAQLVSWHQAGHGWLTVAVNVSAIQLLDPFFVGKIKRLLESHSVPATCLQVELTESVLATNVQHAKKILSQLRKLGVKIAIDDFGTGYSSLNSLQQFDIDYLKVDQSFVREMGSDSGTKICRSIVSLAHSLGMTVIAEGVETAEQFAALYEMGCDELQGYLLAKPLQADRAPCFIAPHQGLWAGIETTRSEIKKTGLELDFGLGSPATGLQLLEMELERAATDFGELDA